MAGSSGKYIPIETLPNFSDEEVFAMIFRVRDNKLLLLTTTLKLREFAEVTPDIED